jgi:hypothetical protein
MITRRRAILGIGLGSSLAAWGFAPGEFWDDKQPAEWSEKDVQRILTKSPWAKGVNLEMDFGAMEGPGMGGPGMEGPGMGGPGMPGPGGPGEPFGMQPTVRWESASPLRSAAKVKLPIDPTGCYVIGVLGLPTEMDARFGDLDLASLKETTFLQRKGGKSVAPNHFIVSDYDGAMLFYFPSDADPISPKDKEVVFQSKIVVYAIKAKFVPKDMLYRGKLAL